MNFTSSDNTFEAAQAFNEKDSLKEFRDEFLFPQFKGQDYLYFTGHSLGLQPKKAREAINEVLDSWSLRGVDAHFTGDHPWMTYHESLIESMSRVMGTKPEETVIMNALTTNLHLMLVSFYRPTKTRYKILIEQNAFPSDIYAVKSQARFHGFDWREAIVELTADQDPLEQIENLKDELALVMMGNVNYLSGQAFDMKAISEKAHEVGAFVGFDLAHGAGNLICDLHNADPDFAVWCTYKYMNSGPGSPGGVFINQKHLGKTDIPRFEGWMGNHKDTRFVMSPEFDPAPGAKAWQLNNHPIFQMAALRASLDLFDKATIKALRKKGDHLTGYLEFLLNENCGEKIEMITPAYSETKQTRGNMLCMRFKNDARAVRKALQDNGILSDFREPDILRIAPAPLYNNYTDVYKLVEIIAKES